MMNYDGIIRKVEAVRNAAMDVAQEEPQYAAFPFPQCYKGQNEAIEAIMAEEIALLCSHTGSGKTPVFLTAAHELGVPTLVIEPRKFLQKQAGEYFQDFTLYGRGSYPCQYAPSVASAPCVVTHKRKGEKYFSIKNQLTGRIEEKPYPCLPICDYLHARGCAEGVLKTNGVLIVNFGNFWQWLPKAEFVVVDEADEFFRSISSAIELLDAIEITDIEEALIFEMDGIKDIMGEIESKRIIELEDAKKLNSLRRQLEKLKFFYENADACFWYTKKKRVFVEIQPQRTHVLMDRLFHEKKICLVTATPSQFVEMRE